MRQIMPLVTLGAGRANMGNIQRRARIGCWQDAVAAVAVDANGGNRQSRFAEAMPVDAHQIRFRGLRVTLAADLDHDLQPGGRASLLAEQGLEWERLRLCRVDFRRVSRQEVEAARIAAVAVGAIDAVFP